MSVRNLDKIFRPRRVALIEIIEAVSSPATRILENLLSADFRGAVYPISSRVESVHGIPTYPDLTSLPRKPDLAVICMPAGQVPRTVQACGEAGIRGILILSSGFAEAGPQGKALEDEVAAVARRFQHMRIIGPNSLGICVPEIGLNASDVVTAPRAGRLAFVSESQALSNAMLDWAADAGIGLSLFASVGNKLDVGFGDLIDYLGTDPKTRAIILYVQSISHARRFMSAARSFARSKPIVVYKAGRFAGSARVALLHTGSMAGEDAVYAAAFERAGVVRATDLDDIFDVAELLASQKLPQGPRLAIVGNAGGPAIIATDALLSRGGVMAGLSKATLERFNQMLPFAWSGGNPIDLQDDAPAERFFEVTELLLAEQNADAVLVIFTNQPTTASQAVAECVARAAERSRKPVLAAWMGGDKVREGIRFLNKSGVPAHATPEQAVRAFMHLVSYARNLETLYETPREIPIQFCANRNKLAKKWRPLLRSRTHLTEIEAKSLLRAYDIPVSETYIASSAEQAVEIATRIGFPVVLKLLSREIVHKVDVGGVVLGLRDGRAVQTAYESMLHRARSHGLGDKVKGVTLQRMVSLKDSLELILGAKKDPTFGAVVMAGLGGITTGVFRDHALSLPPLNERLVRRMLESLRCWPMLQGYRGQPAVNIDRLIEVILRFSCLIVDYPEIREFDINPLLATPDTVLALDAAAILEDDPVTRQSRRYEHLAIRPYPAHYIRHLKLRDGAAVTLRSVRPEDEPLWHDLIARSSPESIRFRFRTLFKHATHQMAVQCCVIDYERELAIVAETDGDGKRELVGIAQLITDLNHETAEYAVLVPDAWQGRGVGGVLLDYCLELARDWGVTQVVAETDPENTRMLTMFGKRGFVSKVHRDEDVVFLQKTLMRERRSLPAS